jgi:hypothetical protein
MKLKMMIMGLGGVVGLMILFGVITGMLRISLLHNNEEQERETILSKLEDAGNLELVHYSLNEASETTPASGEAAACINLKEVKINDIKIERSKVFISLPSPALCYTEVNSGRVSQTGLTGNEKSSGSEMQYREFEAKLRKKAVSTGIYNQAKENADKLVHALLSSVTDKKVILKFRE